jgi:hypothetical protein
LKTATNIQPASQRTGDFELDPEFAEQFKRQLDRPLEARIRYGFNRVYKPVLDDAPWRSFATMAEYRVWCAENLPKYLGFKPAAE